VFDHLFVVIVNVLNGADFAVLYLPNSIFLFFCIPQLKYFGFVESVEFLNIL